MQTIMKVLGHQSPGMSMTYTHISDLTVLADYQAGGHDCAPNGNWPPDAQTRWGREVERHQRTADRIASLLTELGEPL